MHMTVNIESRPRIIQVLWRYGPVLFWMALIFIASSQSSLPSAAEPLADKVWKKFGHITAYAILMWLLLRTFASDKHLSARQSIAAFAMLLLYAVSDEFHQFFVPGRTSTWIDVACFDFLGGCAGWVAFQRFKLGKLQTEKSWMYWLIFIMCLALLFMLNAPYPDRLPQG